MPVGYDLSYRTNLGGLFIAPEYISNFVAGERLVIDRNIFNMPFLLQSITMVVKASEGAANVLITKTIADVANTTGSDGYFTTDAYFNATFNMAFREDETALLDQRRYFVIEATWTGGNGSMVIGRGYLQGTLQQSSTPITNIPIVVIDNLPGDFSIGTFQIRAHAEDGFGNVVVGHQLLYFTSDYAHCPIGPNGFIVVNTPGTYIITVALAGQNVAARETLEVTLT